MKTPVVAEQADSEYDYVGMSLKGPDEVVGICYSDRRDACPPNMGQSFVRLRPHTPTREEHQLSQVFARTRGFWPSSSTMGRPV